LGNYFSANIIAYGAQLDTSKNDNEWIQSQYADAAMIAKKFNIRAYPTFLFFSPNAELVHKSIGSTDAPHFLAIAKKALNPDSAFYTLKQKFDKGLLKNPAQLFLLANEAATLQDKGLSAYALKYIQTQKDMLTASNIQFLQTTTRQLTDTGLKIIVANEQAIDAKTKKGTSNNLIIEALFSSQRELLIKNIKSHQTPNWNELENKFAINFPKHAKLAVLYTKTIFYSKSTEVDKKIESAYEYLTLSPSSIDGGMLNELAMSAYTSTMDNSLLNKALFISKRSFEDDEASEKLDTYACILYKLGQTEEGIKWEVKALSKATTDIDYYKKTIEQMKKGEKIWENQQ
jgi:hypothetical protein